MTANCNATEVRTLISTSLTDEDITSLITIADQYITDRGLTKSLKLISMLFTASLIAFKDYKSYGIGDYRENTRDPQEWRDEMEKVITETDEPTTIVDNP